MIGRGLLAALLLAAASACTAAGTAERLAGFPRGQVLIVASSQRCLLVEAWSAVTEAQRARGLMYVDSLGEFEGMYFGYPEPALITMWMKNTVLSLDMLFVGADGRIARVAARTTPWSEDLIRSGTPVVGVLEVNGGFAASWGVAAGDRLTVLQPAGAGGAARQATSQRSAYPAGLSSR